MRPFRLVLILLLFMLFTVSTQAQAPSFEVDDCPFDVPSDQDIECGYLTVPENRQNPNGNTIELAVAILSSFSDSPASEPIIYLEGGPGGSAVTAPDLWFDTPFRDNHVVILFDQRGTGYSEPSLNCTEFDEDFDSELDAIEACNDRLLSEGIDLTAYNSRENAADVNDLRIALGYDQVNLYGVSYGTRLGLTVMRDFPEGIRSIVLDSVYPPNVETNHTLISDTYALMTAMFDDCDADSACSSAFPDLENRFYAELDNLDVNPALVYDAENDEDVELYSADVLNTLYSQLQTTPLISAIPASLDALANGDYDTYFELASQGADDGSFTEGDDADFDDDEASTVVDEILAELFDDEIDTIEALARDGDADGIYDFLIDAFDMDDDEADAIAEAFVAVYSGGNNKVINGYQGDGDVDDDSEGMFYSVQCNEEVSFLSLDTANDVAQRSDIPQIVVDGLIPVDEFEACEVWESGTADPIEEQAVVSDLPVLLLTASYDTATPPDWAYLAAETLSNSFVFEFAGVGHALVDGGDCPVSIALAFLYNPNAEPDDSCIASMGIDYYIP